MATDETSAINHLSNTVFELKGTISEFMRQWQIQDGRANDSRIELKGTISALAGEVGRVSTEVVTLKGSVTDLHQDVAEMRNDTEVAATKLAELEASKPVVIAAIGDVTALKAFQKTIETQQIYNAGYWGAIKKIGLAGWTIIAALMTVAAGIFIQYGWPYVIAMLRSP